MEAAHCSVGSCTRNVKQHIAPINPSELADAVFAYLGFDSMEGLRGLLAWRATSSGERQRATQQLFELAKSHCSEHVRQDWARLPADATGACAFAIYNKICVICGRRRNGGLVSTFAIPAHCACVLRCCVNASFLESN
ncbi:hypothetical protein JKP88DRAFT_244653 [Tribonema minus]|uniref:Uncharacterized protein n=1 Tax=Tribonema minus TaxID=303371 RepID=A0A835Z9A9_9STRA|nr:hypothetical protein JKP88DRAFT_244653 [Tribonema minus]